MIYEFLGLTIVVCFVIAVFGQYRQHYTFQTTLGLLDAIHFSAVRLNTQVYQKIISDIYNYHTIRMHWKDRNTYQIYVLLPGTTDEVWFAELCADDVAEIVKR
jgi:hypothetical protein